ncbi:MAG: excinuclease ABC subunit C, partial [Oscillospiraceae bacterium]|nr:excinuclease ABC subunit C [Oscillospiraceae bacterium]
LIGRDSFDVSNSVAESEGETLESFITQYYRGEFYIPKTILISHEVEDPEMLERYFRELRGKKTEVKTPLRGANKRIVDMALENAGKNIMNMKTEKVKEQLKQGAVIELAAALKLEVIPDRIESYDVSHISGKDSVSSMIVFKNGRPAKKEYRHFKLDEGIGNDDTESMRRTLTRRFTHEQRKSDGRFSELPDLILMDGGLGQVHVAQEVLSDLGLDIPVYGMVKNDKHRSRGIVGDEGELTLPPGGSAFRLVAQIQEEVHRFAIEYHRKLRNKHLTESELDNIEGIGKAKKAALLGRFKSVSAIKKASVEELCKVSGISEAIAGRIYNYFNKEG